MVCVAKVFMVSVSTCGIGDMVLVGCEESICVVVVGCVTLVLCGVKIVYSGAVVCITVGLHGMQCGGKAGSAVLLGSGRPPACEVLLIYISGSSSVGSAAAALPKVRWAWPSASRLTPLHVLSLPPPPLSSIGWTCAVPF